MMVYLLTIFILLILFTILLVVLRGFFCFFVGLFSFGLLAPDIPVYPSSSNSVYIILSSPLILRSRAEKVRAETKTVKKYKRGGTRKDRTPSSQNAFYVLFNDFPISFPPCNLEGFSCYSELNKLKNFSIR